MKVNIGCGKTNFGKDWYHIDGTNYSHIYSNDIVNLPFKENSIDIIYASHVLEYFDREEVIEVLKKWKYYLKNNGILRLSVPNFKMYAELYTKKIISLDNCIGPLYGKWNMTENKMIYHKTVYDYESLKKLLEDNNFKNIKLWNWRNTIHSNIDDYSQAYIPHMDKEKGYHMSLNIECNK